MTQAIISCWDKAQGVEEILELDVPHMLRKGDLLNVIDITDHFDEIEVDYVCLSFNDEHNRTMVVDCVGHAYNLKRSE